VLKISSGYLTALIAGVILGWLVQQFWFIEMAQDERASQRSIERSELRLERLRQQNLSAAGAGDLISEREEHNGFATQASVDSIETRVARLVNQDSVSAVDFELIKAFIERKRQQGEFQEALIFLYDLRLLLDSEAEAPYQTLIYSYVQGVEEELEKEQRLDALVAMFRLLTSLQAEHIPYYLSLSHWLLASQELDAAELALSSARHDFRYASEVQALEEAIARFGEQGNRYIVPLKSAGEHYLADLGLEGGGRLSLMLDTGASLTVVKSALIEEYFPELIEEAQPLTLNTANGAVQGAKVSLPKVWLGDLLLKDMEVGIIPLPGFGYDGLLGMDVLKRYQFEVDQDAKQLTLFPAD
jgi:clan AA aspartic protease (TIGR02281 family)